LPHLPNENACDAHGGALALDTLLVDYWKLFMFSHAVEEADVEVLEVDVLDSDQGFRCHSPSGIAEALLADFPCQRLHQYRYWNALVLPEHFREVVGHVLANDIIVEVLDEREGQQFVD